MTSFCAPYQEWNLEWVIDDRWIDRTKIDRSQQRTLALYSIKNSSGSGLARSKPFGGLVKVVIISTASVFWGIPAGFSQVSSDVEQATQVFTPDFFDAFQPQTARDMIDRLPGFSLDVGDDLRGFGGTSGNVLIDGSRPSSKSGGIEEALNRIPASSVERIEIIQGSTSNSEAAGQSVVVNVVRRSGESAGRWELEIEQNSKGLVYPRSEISFSNTIGGWETSTNLNSFWEQFPREGLLTRWGSDGALSLSQLEQRPSTLSQGFGSIEAKRPIAGGDLTLNGRIGKSYFNGKTSRLRFDNRLPDSTPDANQFIDFTGEYVEAEFGADYARPFGEDWSVKLLSLTYFRDHDQTTKVDVDRPIGVFESGSNFERNRETFETIVRTTFNRKEVGGLKPEFGGEIAFNRLDTLLELLAKDANGFSIVELPAPNVLVEELRGEAFANLTWNARPKVHVELGFAVEASEISVSGDAENSQTFTFAKPSATFIYNPRNGVQFRLGARRSVGQLNFSDFAASVSATDDRQLAGNPDLGPDQTTRLSFASDFRSDRYGALTLEVFHDWKSDVLEQVELSGGGFGLANAGDGRLWGVTGNLSLPLSEFVPGALIEVEAEASDSDFADPISGIDRGLNRTVDYKYEIEFRQDFEEAQIAIGTRYASEQNSETYFANEINENETGEHWTAFIETTRLLGLKSRLEFSNIGGQKLYRNRRFFDPDRSAAETGSEQIDRRRGEFITLTLSGQF